LNDHVQVIVGEAPETTGTGWFNPAIDRGRVIAEPRWPSPTEEVPSNRPSQPSAIASEPVPPASMPTSPLVTTAPATTAPVTSPVVTTAPATTAQARETQTTPARAQSSSVQASPMVTTAQVPSTPEPAVLSPDEYLRKAKEEFDAGRVASAISFVDQFCIYYPSGSDEAWWLYGQFYEANSPSRNILLSLDYYRRLVREYPQSSRAGDARRRIAFLERFYININ